MKRKISIPTMELKNSNERKKFHNYYGVEAFIQMKRKKEFLE
jgi:hypothetical protein